jgi:hypothetical protein
VELVADIIEDCGEWCGGRSDAVDLAKSALEAAHHAELVELLTRVIDLEAPAEHLPEPISSDLLGIIDDATALLAKLEAGEK